MTRDDLIKWATQRKNENIKRSELSDGDQFQFHSIKAETYDLFISKLEQFEDGSFAAYSKALTEARTKGYPLCGSNMVYPALKCAGEAGELADKIGKHWRNTVAQFTLENKRRVVTKLSPEVMTIRSMSAATMSPEFKAEVIKEMGDVLWYLWAMCEEMGTTLDHVAQVNIVKVTDRRDRGVVCSEGDNR